MQNRSLVTNLSVTVENEPRSEGVQFVRRGLQQHNAIHGHIDEAAELAALLRDADGQIAGGIHADTWGNVCEINFLWVEEGLRGQGHGRRLVEALESPALVRGCTVAVLDTYWIHTGYI